MIDLPTMPKAVLDTLTICIENSRCYKLMHIDIDVIKLFIELLCPVEWLNKIIYRQLDKHLLSVRLTFMCRPRGASMRY